VLALAGELQVNAAVLQPFALQPGAEAGLAQQPDAECSSTPARCRSSQ
jgi:hypothetical protein